MHSGTAYFREPCIGVYTLAPARKPVPVLLSSALGQKGRQRSTNRRLESLLPVRSSLHPAIKEQQEGSKAHEQRPETLRASGKAEGRQTGHLHCRAQADGAHPGCASAAQRQDKVPTLALVPGTAMALCVRSGLAPKHKTRDRPRHTTSSALPQRNLGSS